jgi:Fe-S cluster assembly protein SufD
MSALLDSFCRRVRRLAPREGDASARAAQALDEALRDGLPGPRSEAWKYTSLRALERRSFAAAESRPAGAGPDAAGRHPGAAHGVRQRPLLDAVASDLPTCRTASSLPLSECWPRAANAARANFLQRRYAARRRSLRPAQRRAGERRRRGCARRCRRTPRRRCTWSSSAPPAGDRAWHLRHLIELRNDAAWHGRAPPRAGDHAHLANHVSHVHLAASARGSACAHAGRAPPRHLFAAHRCGARARCRLPRVDLELGAALSRHELNVRLEGDGARCRPTACCWPTAAAMSIPAWASNTSPATPPAN